MALTNATPQMQFTSSQLTSVWNGVRRLTAGVTRRISQRGESKEQTLQATNDVKVKEELPSLSLDGVEMDPAAISILYSRNNDTLKSHWRESHASLDTFQQNITATSLALDMKAHEVYSAILGPRMLRYSPALVREALYQQTRGFKTRRSETTGLVSGRQLGKIDPVKVPASSANLESEMFAQSLPIPGDSDKKIGLSKFLSSAELSAEEERKVKLSFVDGFHAGNDWRAFMEGFNSLKGSPLRARAFFEGYKCYYAASGSRDTSRSIGWAKLVLGLMLLIGTQFMLSVASMILFFMLVSANISNFIETVKCQVVSLLSGDQNEVNPESVSVTFDDVRGLSEAKEELANIVDFLKNPSKYTDLGAKLPNGCLLVGPPGVGKTLLAKAVAGEAGVPFFQASGAEFEDAVVGTGAKRVRQLFQAAKAKAPCVIFIDEIDSVGSKRTSSKMHPYANQTVNQLLTEMDGFEDNVGVIVLGATNKKSNLDKALLRPGRFDVEVSIGVPDLNERIEILNLYLPKIVTDGQVDVKTIAKRTVGCTGADLSNICNHAAMKAASDHGHVVTMEHIEFAIDKVQMGPQKKRVVSPQVNRYTAYHEAGHAIMQYYSRVNTSKLHKITILPRGQSLGMTHFILEEKREFQYTKEEMLVDLDALMGGRVAEELIFGENKVSAGAASDMQKATTLATAMVAQYGFSDKIGLRVHSADDPMSDRLKEEMDDEIKQVLKDSYERSKQLLSSKQKQLHRLAEALLEYEELTYDEAKTVIDGGKLNRPSISPCKPTSGPSDQGTPTTSIPHIKPSKPVKL